MGLSLEFHVCSRSLLHLEWFSLNFGQIFLSVRWCAEHNFTNSKSRSQLKVWHKFEPLHLFLLHMAFTPKIQIVPTLLFCFERFDVLRNGIFLAHLSRRLIGELIVYQWLRRPSVRPSSVNIFKHLLLRNYWANWTHISYVDSLGWGNESLFEWFWSHDQDGRHAHIW